MTRATDRFNSQIQGFARLQSGNERPGTVTKKEMEAALAELAPGADGRVSSAKLKAAKDLLESGNVRLTRGGKEALKNFIQQAEGASPAAAATTPAEMKTLLDGNAQLAEGVFEMAFGRGSPSAYAHQVNNISMMPDGKNFNVEVTRFELVGLGNEHKANVLVDPDGKALSATPPRPARVLKVAADIPFPPAGPTDDPVVNQPPPNPRPDVFKIRADDPIDADPVDATPATPTRASTAADMKLILGDDNGKLDALVASVFGRGHRGAYAFSVGDVSKRADGNFDVEVERHELVGLGNVDVQSVVVDPDGDLVAAPRRRPTRPSRPPTGGGRIFKVAADDPVDDPAPASAPSPPSRPRRPPGGGGFGGGRVFKIAADE